MGPQRQQVLASHDSTCGALAAWAAQGVSWRTVSLCQTSRAHQATRAQVPSSRVPLLALSPAPKPHAWWSKILEKCWGATTCGNSRDGTGHGYSQLFTYILQGCMGTTKAFFAQTEAWQLFVVLIHTWAPRQVWQSQSYNNMWATRRFWGSLVALRSSLSKSPSWAEPRRGHCWLHVACIHPAPLLAWTQRCLWGFSDFSGSFPALIWTCLPELDELSMLFSSLGQEAPSLSSLPAQGPPWRTAGHTGFLVLLWSKDKDTARQENCKKAACAMRRKTAGSSALGATLSSLYEIILPPGSSTTLGHSRCKHLFTCGPPFSISGHPKKILYN